MSDPLTTKEIISLIEDFQRSPGNVEWFIPHVRGVIAIIEDEICDIATSPEQTARLKIERSVWMAVLQLPEQQHAAHHRNQQVRLDAARGVKRED